VSYRIDEILPPLYSRQPLCCNAHPMMARLDRFLRGTASFLFLSCLLDFSLVEFRTSIPEASPRNKEREMSADLSRSLSDPCTSVWRQWKCEEVRTGHPATQWRPNHSVRTAVNYSSSVASDMSGGFQPVDRRLYGSTAVARMSESKPRKCFKASLYKD